MLLSFSHPELSQLINEVDTTDLIEAVAHKLLIEPDEVAKRVAEVLCLGPARSVELPSEETLTQSGYDIQTLKQVVALPQRSRVSRMGFAMVVADPTIIDPEEFYDRGIPVLLATGSAIRNAWTEFEWNKTHPGISQVSEAQAFAVIRQLAEDASDCGAAEVFIGHPQPDAYEFLVGSGSTAEKYMGKLHPYIYPLLMTQFRESFKLERDTHDSRKLKCFSLSLTRNFEHPVLCLTWEKRETDKLDAVVDDVPTILPTQESSPDASESETTSEKKAEQPSKPRQAVLLDDDERFLTILTRILVSKGWEVERFTNAQVALDLFQEKQLNPDLIVSDVHMPHMDGGTFLKQFKSMGLETPVLMLTSDDDKLLEAELALIGADAFVRKQEDPRILLAWCNNLVQRHVKSQPIEPSISH